jgi:hypothetical protein
VLLALLGVLLLVVALVVRLHLETGLLLVALFQPWQMLLQLMVVGH